MPHIAFELDAIPKVSLVARSAGVPEGAVAWGLVQLWEWCWRGKRDTVEGIHLRGFFGCDVEAALVAFGFLEKAEACLRVRGAQRYLRIQKGNAAGGQAAKGHLIPGGGKPKSSPGGAEREPRGSREGAEEVPRVDLGSTANSEQRAASIRTAVEAAPPLSALPANAPPDRPATVAPHRGPLVYEKPATPTEAWLFPDFYAFFQWLRQQAGLPAETSPPHEREGAAWWSACLMTPGVDALAMKRAVHLFGKDKHWEAQGFPFRGFKSQWASFVAKEKARAAS
jgi:hypothetical protein